MKKSGKSKSSGIAVLVNNRWTTVKHCFCSPNIELLAVSFCPCYLQREFSSVIVVTIYILPSAGADTVCDIIISTVAELQTQQPSAFLAITDDSNDVSLCHIVFSFFFFLYRLYAL